MTVYCHVNFENPSGGPLARNQYGRSCTSSGVIIGTLLFNINRRVERPLSVPSKNNNDACITVINASNTSLSFRDRICRRESNSSDADSRSHFKLTVS